MCPIIGCCKGLTHLCYRCIGWLIMPLKAFSRLPFSSETTVLPRAGSLWGPWRSACPRVWGSSTAAWRCRCPEDSRRAYTASRPPRPPCGGSANRHRNHRMLEKDSYPVSFKTARCCIYFLVLWIFKSQTCRKSHRKDVRRHHLCTWLPLRPSHGSCPWVNISHRVTPNIQVSDAWEKVRDFRDSGAHLRRGREKYIMYEQHQNGSHHALKSEADLKKTNRLSSHHGKGILCPSSMMYWSVCVGSALIRPKSPIFTVSLVDSRTLRAARSLWRKRLCSR